MIDDRDKISNNRHTRRNSFLEAINRRTWSRSVECNLPSHTPQGEILSCQKKLAVSK